MNRIDRLFSEKKNNILSVYFTAGYPERDSTGSIIRELAKAGADMIEIGIPFSDPMADGPVIQHSNNAALRNGMNLKLLFSQLKGIRNDVDIPILLMGYLNPVFQYGIDNFCRSCSDTGIDGMIIPDLPPLVFEKDYKLLFREHELHNILLITPQSDETRIREIDSMGNGFIYMVSSAAVTGSGNGMTEQQTEYFTRVKAMNLKNPTLIGFGISGHESFNKACTFSNGGIIGSAFISILEKYGYSGRVISDFINTVHTGR